MPPDFLPTCEDNPLFWAWVGWCCFLVVCAWCVQLLLRLVARVVARLASLDQSDWVLLWTKLFYRFAAGHLYVLNDKNEVLDSERVCLVVAIDEEEGGRASAYLAFESGHVQTGTITYHRYQPRRNPLYGPNVVLVNGKPPVHWDVVGCHTGNFIFSRRPIALRDLAALRQEANTTEVVTPATGGASP